MKTIELMINGQKAQFTTKSVTLDGKEYFYSNMTKLDHSPVVHSYMFEYDGESKRLTYEKKDTKIMTAIFSQVNKMIDLKKAKEQEKPAEKPAEATKPAEAVNTAEEAKAAEPAAEVAEVSESPEAAEPAAEAAETSDEMDEMVKATIALNEERAKKEAEKAAKKAKKKAIKEAKKNGTPLPEEEKKEDGSEDSSEEVLTADPEKQARLKRSLKIFAIVLAVIIAASLIYYFVFGTSNAPSGANPAVTESQQYEDIDQLIEDLQ